MDHKILFIVWNGEIKFLQNSTMDHKEWYLSLGGNLEDYDNVIRGYIVEDKIIFFKANLNYDTEVIDFATKMGFTMKQQLNQPSYKICCGINPGHDGVKWEPILVLKDEDLQGYKTEEEMAKEKKEFEKQIATQMSNQETGPIIEFKNNIEDPKFRRYATLFTLTLFIIAIIEKAILVNNKTLMTSNRWNTLLIGGQALFFVLTMIGYNQKSSKTKYFGILASILSFFFNNRTQNC